MKNVRRRGVAGLTTLAMLAAVALTVVPAAAQESPPECPPAPAGAIVVDLPFEELYTNRGEAAAIGSTVSANVPAGNYDIRITGWDDHVIGDVIKETQLREVFQVQGFNGGSVVFTTGETPDLPDDQNTVTAYVNYDVAVPDLTSMRAIHSDPDRDETANSIHPICIVFIPVAEETTTTTQPETTTTTQPEVTTTTQPEATTTTQPEATTTTTVPQATTTTVGPTATTSPPEVQATTTVPSTLPFTGVETEHLAIVAFAALAAGAGLVLATRKNAEATHSEII